MLRIESHLPNDNHGGVHTYRLGERLNGIQEVSGSIPLISTKHKSLENTMFSRLYFSAAPESAIPPCDINFGLNVCVFDLFLQNATPVRVCHSIAYICTQVSSTPEGLYCFPHYLTGKSLYIGQQSPVAVPCSRRGNSTIGVHMDRYLVVVSAASGGTPALRRPNLRWSWSFLHLPSG